MAASGLISPRHMRSRTHSLSSDRPSTIGLSLVCPPTHVSPEPIYIAASAASQIVTNDHDSHADTWYDQHGIEPAGETAIVSPAALQLVNNFLDQLLFNFLQVSKATTLVALRPSVTEALKPKLAKDAINNADEELREYLGGADEEDYIQPQGSRSSRDWDLELVWKRTRLRCMVYSSLGDMEEEDEDIFMEQENLEIGADEQISDVISPAVAIFLTSVLEYMGELTLTVAGQAAYHRMRVRFEKDLKEGIREPTDLADRIVVDDVDMERVALDRTLGRLWRGWKKRIRTPGIDALGRSFSRSSNGHSRQDSHVAEVMEATAPATPDESMAVATQVDDQVAVARPNEPESDTKADADADADTADQALNNGDGPYELALPADEEDSDDDQQTNLRPKSVVVNSSWIANALNGVQLPPMLTRTRSSSVPVPTAKSFFSKKGEEADASGDEGAEAAKVDGAEKDDTATEASFQDAVETSDSSKESSVAETADEAPSATKNPLAKIPDVIAAGVATIASAALGSESKRPQGSEEMDDTKYERAEIMTSSRVSVSSSTSPALSDAGKRFSSKRSSSVHSARLIEVTSPRTPRSVSPSGESIDRRRQASFSGARSVSPPSSGDEGLGFRAGEPALVTPLIPEKTPEMMPTVMPAALAPERNTGPRQLTASTISETAEEADTVPALLKSRTEPVNFSKPSPVVHGTYGTSNVNWSPVRHQPSKPATKVTILGTSNTSANLAEDTTPEIPRKASARHNTRDGMSPPGIERTRTNDSADDPMLPLQSNSTTRPTHTSGSSASSAKGGIRAIRTSEEQLPSRAESMARNFEELIHSNQTITYTLTPENMRDIDSKHSLESPMVSRFPRKSEDHRNANRSRPSSAATELKTTATGHRPTPLSSHPINETVSPISPISPNRPSRPSAQAREARVPSESVAEFAEFIKSTGPPGAQAPRAAPMRPSNTVNNAASQVVPAPSPESRRGSTTTANRNRYQPREASVDQKDTNSDLVDFLRQGPPGGSVTPTSQRVPRHMQDQMSPASGGRPIDGIPDIRYSQASTNVTDTSMPSMQSSVNSSSALIKNQQNQPTSAPRANMFDEEDMMPKRKTRRVKDPYAIDFSDEEDDDFMVERRPPPKQEESLADFLRNYEPPPTAKAPPPPVVAQKAPKKKSSAPSLMGRLTRGYYHRDHHNSTGSDTASQDTRSVNSRTGTNSISPGISNAPNGANGAKGHVPIQINMASGFDESPVNRPRMSSQPGPTGRVPMKKYEPREASANSPKTSDLAAFLRDSGPPDAGTAPMARTGTASPENNGLSKMLGRRRKPAGYA